MRIEKIVTALGLTFGLALVDPAQALAHCDSLDGPPEIQASFERTLTVRTLSPQAKELADRFFLETVVRVHRSGKGAPFTGLKPAWQRSRAGDFTG